MQMEMIKEITPTLFYNKVISKIAQEDQMICNYHQDENLHSYKSLSQIRINNKKLKIKIMIKKDKNKNKRIKKICSQII
jgi:hypothetical protein